MVIKCRNIFVGILSFGLSSLINGRLVFSVVVCMK